MDPLFVTGFTDGEGCFHIAITKRKDFKLGRSVELAFEINLNEKDIALLKQIQNFFRVGSINYKEKTKSFMFKVSSSKDLKVIINHFDKYPLITEKCSDFKLFKQAFHLIERQEHLTVEGLCKIVALKASMNRGLTPKLISEFPDVIPVNRPIVLDKIVPDPH